MTSDPEKVGKPATESDGPVRRRGRGHGSPNASHRAILPASFPPDVSDRLLDALEAYAVVLLDLDGTIVSWNAGAQAIKGYRPDEIIGRSFVCLYTPEAVAVGHPERELEYAATTGRWAEEGWRRRKDGTRFWASVVITALRDDDGEVFGFGKVTADLTARKQAEEQAANALRLLRSSVRTDPLTGLLNLRGWHEALERERNLAARRGSPLCVGVIDVDHFKRVNDAGGHEAGDRFLRRAAAAWRAQLRAGDIVARTGGDEFAVALIDCDPEGAHGIVDRMRTATPDGATCSAGVACWDGTESVVSLVKRADAALYAAKAAGRDRTVMAARDNSAANAPRA